MTTTTTPPDTPAADKHAQTAPAAPFPLDAVRLIGVAVALGFSVDVLFWEQPLGISFLIFMGLACLALLVLAALERVRPAWRSLWLLFPILGLAALVAVRAEPLTTFLNVVVPLALGALWARTFTSGRLFDFGILDYVLSLVLVAAEAIYRPFTAFVAANRQMRNEARGRRIYLPIVRGLLIATPILCVFTLLLSSADLVFADRVQDVLDWLKIDSIGELIGRIFIIATVTFLAVGVFVQSLYRIQPMPLLGKERALAPNFLGLTESGIVLGSINALFGAFVAIQFRYFFGGQANINAEGYTYAEYARRGFGELVAVAFFTLLILLVLGAATRRNTSRSEVTFNLLSTVMVGLVGVILVSALQRLLLYESIFGFTRLRTYSHVAIIWLGALFLIFLVTLFIRRPRLFASGVMLVVIGFSATLNGLNVDAFIARQNVQHTIGDLDTRYLNSLSDDAVPVLLPLLRAQDHDVRSAVGRGLACRLALQTERYAEVGWQATNFSHRRALRELTDAELSAYPVTENDYGNLVVDSPGADTLHCSYVLQREIFD